MQQENRVYIAIDLKSFYASVECREPHGKDHLPIRVPGHEGLRGSRAAPAVRGGAEGPGGQRRTADRGSRTRPHRLFLGFE